MYTKPRSSLISIVFLLVVLSGPLLSMTVKDYTAIKQEAKKILEKIEKYTKYYNQYKTYLSDVRENILKTTIINKRGILIDQLESYFENLVYEKLEEYFENNPVMNSEKFDGVFKEAYKESVNLGDDYQYIKENDYQQKLGVYRRSNNYRNFIDTNIKNTDEQSDMVQKLFNILKLSKDYDAQRQVKLVELQPLIKEWSQSRDTSDGWWNTPNNRGKLISALADLKLMKLVLFLQIKKLYELREELLTMEKIYHVDRINRKQDLMKNNVDDMKGLYDEKK